MYESWNPYPSISWNRIQWSMSPNAPLKSEYVVYKFCVDSFASSYIFMCADRLSWTFWWERNPSAVSLNIPSESVICVPIVDGEDGCPNLKYAIHEGNGFVDRRVVWVCFVGFVYKFCGTNAQFLRHVAMFSHYLEECIYEIVGCFG